MQEIKQEKSPIKERILQYLELKGITKYSFYKESGISRNILDQQTGISEENISRFLAYAPEVSVNWLLTGKGSMLKSEASNFLPSTDSDLNDIISSQVEKLLLEWKRTEDRLLSIIESQQRVIENLSNK